MGLAAYGQAAGIEVPALVDIEGEDYRLRVADSERADMETRRGPRRLYKRLVRAWGKRFAEVAGCDSPALPPGEVDRDPAAVLAAYAAQRLIEETVTWLAAKTRELTGLEQLCPAGGVALNCSTNGQLPGPLYLPPVPHDSGAALGAAWSVAPPRERRQLSPYLGSEPGAPGTATRSGFCRREWDAKVVAGLLLDGRIADWLMVEPRLALAPSAIAL